MSSREKILSAVFAAQPAGEVTDSEVAFILPEEDTFSLFTAVLASIGGTVYEVKHLSEIAAFVGASYANRRVISVIPEVGIDLTSDWLESSPRQLEDVELAIIRGHFGVAENAAIWITEELVKHRVLPFICQHLAIVINRKDILPTMHQAYDSIGESSYGFGTFIAGPSKTADIEQSLVLGAHGPKSLTVFVLGE